MERKMIRIAGNTHNPALLVLREKGYRVWIEPTDDEDTLPDWRAERHGWEFSATTPVELLGLVAMQEVRGADWKQKAGERDLSGEAFAEAYPDD